MEFSNADLEFWENLLKKTVRPSFIQAALCLRGSVGELLRRPAVYKHARQSCHLLGCCKGPFQAGREIELLFLCGGEMDVISSGLESTPIPSYSISV